MATELAKAYVQIVPSAQGIQGSITNVLDPEAKSAGTNAGDSIGSNIVSGIKKIVVAAGLGTVIKEALSAGADYEQNVGGIETLFGEGAQTMIENASNAYKTAGLSANEYMETVTGFAASLKQSVGGDMEALTSAANTAVIDMADNANKMGTSMESIQSAYAGFSKQNYTMLDNLKLGYGGTKTEMERLLADASKLSGVKYDISNLSDVYAAIHVIQDDLGITGTTAKEAATTFSGSMASMKGAAQNLLASLATGGDVGASLSALVDSFSTFFWDNAIPMLGNILSSVPEIVGTLLQTATQQITNLAANADSFVDFALTLITNLATAIISNLPALVGALFDLAVGIGEALINYDWAGTAQTFATTLSDSFSGEMLMQGANMIINLVTGIAEGLPQLITSAGEMLTTFYSGYLDNLPTIINAGIELISNFVGGIAQNLPAIAASIAQVVANILKTFIEHLPEIVAMGIKLIGELITGVLKAIPTIVKTFVEIGKTIINTFREIDWKSIGKNLIDGIINGIKEAGSKIWETIKSICADVFKSVKDFFKIGSPSKLMADEVGRWIPAGIAQGIANNTAPLTDEMENLAMSTVGTINGALVGDLRTSPNIAPAQTTTAEASKADVYKILEEYLPIIVEYVKNPFSVNDRELFRRVSDQNRVLYKAKQVDLLDPTT
jgi:phage-related protein